MPFKILNKKDANVDELAKAFAEIEAKGAGLEGQKKEAYAEMVRCQQDAMSGKKGAATKLDQAKAAHQDIELQVEACQNALSQIRARITAALPGHFRQQISALDKKHQASSRRRDELIKEWLTACARAATINEQISGRDIIHLRNGDMKQGTPDPGFSYPALGHENQLFYLEKVREYRSKVDAGESLNMELGRISSEIDKLEKLLGQGDLSAEAEKLIDSYRAEAPAAETDEVSAAG